MTSMPLFARPGRVSLAGLLVPLLSACGAGTAGIVAGSSDGGGGSAPTLALSVPSSRVSPAALHLEASASVTAELFYVLPGALPKPLAGLSGVSENRVELRPGVNPLHWDFAAQLGAAFRPEVELLALRTNRAPIQGGSLRAALGNDVPVLGAVEPIPTDPSDPSESSGIVEVRLTVSDSSSDVVTLAAEWRREGDAPDAWQPASAAGVFPDGIETSPDGVELSFFWNTNVDLREGDDDVVLRFRPDDRTLNSLGIPVGRGEWVESRPFHVDNNEEPIVQLDSGPLILNPDERRGIPIPFRVIDEEGDLVEVIFQWRREGEEFPELPRDMAQLDAILADPELRREHRICTEYPRYAQGRVIPIDADTVRLPELASSESWILAGGLEGRTLELLRPSSIPQPITPTWASNPLVSPIAALPVGDGLSALVLDVPGNGRLREIELATGMVVREIATIGPGIPSAMAFERRDRAVLVALDDAGTWRIARVELASGALTELIVSDGSQPAPVRGIASLGTNAAVFTAGSSLFHLDYRHPLVPRRSTLAAGLATPWGVVVDPLLPQRLFVSERDGHRLLEVELDSRSRQPVVVRTVDLQPGTLTAPEALAVAGSRLLVVSSAAGGGRQLACLHPGARGGNASFAIPFSIPGEPRTLATGAHEMRIVAFPEVNELLIGGGIEQARAIERRAYTDLDLHSALDLPLRSGDRWRIAAPSGALVASAVGTPGSFVWDSSDASSGSILVRATPRDAELGLPADGNGTKTVRSPLMVEPLVVSGGAGGYVEVADLDQDGDADLALNSSGGPSIHFQESRGIFGSPLLLSAPPASDVHAADLDQDGDVDLAAVGGSITLLLQTAPGMFGGPLAVAGSIAGVELDAGDLDGDGDLDLACANQLDGLSVYRNATPGGFVASPSISVASLRFSSVAVGDLDNDGALDLAATSESVDTLAVFFQSAPGTFGSTPVLLQTADRPASIVIADVDGDGGQDLLTANTGANNLTAFLQQEPGQFGRVLVLGGPLSTNEPRSVRAADMDGDGDVDVASSNLQSTFSPSSVSVLFQTSQGVFDANPAALDAGGEFELADVDGDGAQDVVTEDGRVFLQSPPDDFASAPPVRVGGPGATDRPVSVAIADLDGDGDLDLASANFNGGVRGLAVFLQNSPGRFASLPLVLGGGGIADAPFSVTAADLDGDGDQDLASANNGGDDLTVFFQLEPGRFDSSALVLGGTGTTDGPRSIVAADLDFDGDLDLVAANERGDDLTVFRQGPSGTHTGIPFVLGDPATTDGPFALRAADLDLDGDMDLASANASGDDVAVFLQLSPATFGPALLLGDSATTDFPTDVFVADLNGDGHLDLASANNGSESLAVFFQTALGDFVRAPLVLPTPRPNSLTAADLDRDGDADLVSAGLQELRVFHQTSPGRFRLAGTPLVPGTTTLRSVGVIDLDGDGDPDLLMSSQGSNVLTVMWGGH